MRVLSPCLCYASYSHTNTTTPHPFPTRRSSDLHPLVLDGDRLVALLELDDVGQGLATGLVAAEDLDVGVHGDRKSTRLNSSHVAISYAVFCMNKKINLKQ